MIVCEILGLFPYEIAEIGRYLNTIEFEGFHTPFRKNNYYTRN